MGGTDPDGTVASYKIDTLPPVAQGVLFLGDPANGGVAVTPGQVLTPAQISQLFFQSTGAFTGANFTYSATSVLLPGVNQPPVANNANVAVAPGGTIPLTGLGGTDPDGTVASYKIDTLPPAAQGVLFLGNPANGGVAVTPGQVLTPAQISQLFFQSTGAFTGANFTYSATLRRHQHQRQRQLSDRRQLLTNRQLPRMPTSAFHPTAAREFPDWEALTPMARSPLTP
ncbi:MAG: hypothetical protein EAZ73_30680 [Oscillatoriales cyanobacterium]|nr:MAG: hypothetical protein EAZ73_30680 [Oscillatoriales cyanobacterium]